LLLLLSAGPFGFIQRQGDGKDELVIHAPQFLDKLTSSLQKPQIKYGIDVDINTSIEIPRNIISDDYILGTSLDLLSAALLTYPSRGPPRLTTTR
jgi:hypothetical protein